MATKKATTKKSTAKKSTPKTTAKRTPVQPIIDTPMSPETYSQSNPASSKQTFNLVVLALVVVALVMGFMRFKYLFVPAVVNGSPIYSWHYVKMLNQTAGRQVIDQMVVEKIIAQEADKQNVTLTNEEIDAEFARLNTQFENVGGLDAFLASQGLDKASIQTQIELNLKVQKILADKVSVTDEEVDTYYTENSADYAEVTADEAKTEIKQMLTEQALQQQIGTWIQDLRSQAQVTINLPGLAQ